jgi:adenine-specific DNA-methyltransferase
MPTLNWLGKDKIATHHCDVPFHCLSHRYGFTAEGATDCNTGSGNRIIHGDNLTALKSLLPEFEERVDCIYIDPPYNTGNEDWVYNDNVNDPQIRRWLGDVVGKEGEDLSRHDKWLCMMFPRLCLLNRLLSHEGAIFISIDKNEFAALKTVCDTIFNNFVGCISWQRTYSPRNDSQGIVSETEYILVYSKSRDWQPRRLERTDEMDAKYKNPDNDRCKWMSSDAFAPGAATHQGMVYAVQNPFTGKLIYPPKNRCWAFEQPEVLRIMNQWCPYELRDIKDATERGKICGVKRSEVRQDVCALMLREPLRTSRRLAREVLERGQWPKLYLTKGGEGGIRRKSYLDQMEGKVVTNLWKYEEVGHTDEAKKELKDIFGGNIPFDTPKPVRLIERILHIATRHDSIVLDSFAGSGTTAHAVLRQNARDGGQRRFILIEMMDYADSTTAERVKRVITGYPTKQRHEVELFCRKLTPKSLLKGAEMMAEAERIISEKSGEYSEIGRPKIENDSLKVVASKVTDGRSEGLAGAFDFYEIGEALFTPEGYLNPKVSEEQVRSYVYFSETRQHPLLYETGNYLLGNADGTAFYLYYDRGEQRQLSLTSLNSIVRARAERYVIYADSCTLSEEFMANHNIVFKKLPRDIKRF